MQARASAGATVEISVLVVLVTSLIAQATFPARSARAQVAPPQADQPGNAASTPVPAGAPPAQSATATMRGRVIAASTGQPVAGAFVSAGNGTWSQAALTEADGSFVIVVQGPVSGAVEVVATADGFQPQVVSIVLGAGDTSLELTLSEATPGSGEVVILTGEAPEIAKPTSYDLAPEDIRILPGSGNDTLKSLQSMPGVARVPFGLGGLVLRGTSPRDTNVYLDGIEVPLLYHFGGLASFYPSSMLDSLELIPGAFGAPYGRAQGGIVTLTSRPGRADRWRVNSEVSLIDASVRADGPGLLGGTWSLGLRRSYVDAVLALVVPEDSEFALTLAPRYYDGQLRYDLDLGKGRSIAVMLFGSDDRLSFVVADDDDAEMESNDFRYVSRFARAAVRFRHRAEGVDLAVTPWIGTEANILRFGAEGFTNEILPMGLRADATRTWTRGQLSGGLDLQGGRFTLDINGEPVARPGMDPTEDSIQRTTEQWFADLGFWVEGLYRIADGKVSIKPGARLDHFGLTGEWVVDPRLTVAHELPGGVTLKESIGIYHQPPVPPDLDPLSGNPDLTSSYSVQSAIGAEVTLPLGIQLSTTGFYDELHDIPVDVVTTATAAADPGSPTAGGAGAISRELTSAQFGSYSYQENVGRGRSYGLETMLRGSRGAADEPGSWLGWISYTYARAFRTGDPGQFQGALPYVLDQPHLLTALGSVQLTRAWRLGARVRYATGNPITPAQGAYFDTDTQEYQPWSGPLLSERLPAFFQLDLRLDRQWKRSYGTFRLFLDVQNVTNRLNAEGVTYNFDYSEVEYTRGLPIFPSLGLEYQP